MRAELDITGLGTKGDGLAEHQGARLHVAFALPGERVVADIAGERAELAGIIAPSPERAPPICRHYGRCGGCALQHWAEPAIAAWKRDRLRQTLARAGLAVEPDPTMPAHGLGRRRVTLHVRRRGEGKAAAVEAGFMRRQSHELIDLDSCPLLVSTLAPVPAIARAIGAALASLGKPLDVQATATDQGLDIDIRGAGRLTEALRQKLVVLAGAHDLARLTLHGERIVEARVPTIRFASPALAAYLPPAAFLQATAEAEEVLAGLALEALAGARSIADLFCGLGPFTLRLARRMKVQAFDADKPAIAALVRSLAANPGGKPASAQARDLFRRPLLPIELAAFDAVLIDPPRQGAEAQCREIARSRLARLAYISCDPESFARDAALLAGAGFRLTKVTPVDQFRFSPHIELVGVFGR